MLSLICIDNSKIHNYLCKPLTKMILVIVATKTHIIHPPRLASLLKIKEAAKWLFHGFGYSKANKKPRTCITPAACIQKTAVPHRKTVNFSCSTTWVQKRLVPGRDDTMTFVFAAFINHASFLNELTGRFSHTTDIIYHLSTKCQEKNSCINT